MTFTPGKSGNPGGRPKTAKLFRDALMVELKRTDGDVERIQKVAQRLVENAINGETAAIREIGDRIDGKVPQAIVGDNEADPVNVLQRIERLIVDPANTNSASVPPALAAG